MLAIARKVLRNSRGATAVEYGLILALIVVALIGTLTLLAGTTNGMWNDVAATVQKS